MASEQLRPTVWDRLIEGESALADRPGDGRVYGLRNVCESIRRDITRLLNTRACGTLWDSDLEELSASLANFGVPDYTGGNMMNSTSREALRRGVEDAIRNFEPRLSSIRVSLPDGVDENSRTIRLRVDARVTAGGSREPVSFESRLDPADRRFSVEVTG